MIGFNFDYLCSATAAHIYFVWYFRFRSIYWLLWVCTRSEASEIYWTENLLDFIQTFENIGRILLLFNYFSVTHDEWNYEITFELKGEESNGVFDLILSHTEQGFILSEVAITCTCVWHIKVANIEIISLTYIYWHIVMLC